MGFILGGFRFLGLDWAPIEMVGAGRLCPLDNIRGGPGLLDSSCL